jgi:CheY-like chemotaxis protein
MLENDKSKGTGAKTTSSTEAAAPNSMNANQSLSVILLVEDDPLVRVQIADALRDAGWDVLEANSGERAVLLLQSGQQIDVVFTDIQLSGSLSGWDVAEEGRSVQSAMPVIYASGNSADHSRSVPNSLFFEKPYDPLAVVEACRRFRRTDI